MAHGIKNDKTDITWFCCVKVCHQQIKSSMSSHETIFHVHTSLTGPGRAVTNESEQRSKEEEKVRRKKVIVSK